MTSRTLLSVCGPLCVLGGGGSLHLLGGVDSLKGDGVEELWAEHIPSGQLGFLALLSAFVGDSHKIPQFLGVSIRKSVKPLL